MSNNSEWILKMWYLYTIAYYIVVKNNESMQLAVTWMKMEDMMLNKVSLKKDNYRVILLIHDF